ncbi:hypothetical protein [Listeria booriae]|uniref:hypothetical protein n=1 Tax=Listeria booriae TaxID=1552123 RepID=UPI00162A08DE|nr:hypothetical protein [Listeria booriae]MBC2163454.1 hypothetical protein [Listeria booriae]
MKTKEFKKAVEALGFDLFSNRGYIRIDIEDEIFASVNCNRALEFDVDYTAYKDLADIDKRALFTLLFEYASTPIAEREEPKKYYVKCPITKMYLNQETQDDDSFLWTTSKRETSDYRTKFTRAEIEAYDLEHLIEEEVPNNER